MSDCRPKVAGEGSRCPPQPCHSGPLDATCQRGQPRDTRGPEHLCGESRGHQHKARGLGKGPSGSHLLRVVATAAIFLLTALPFVGTKLNGRCFASFSLTLAMILGDKCDSCFSNEETEAQKIKRPTTISWQSLVRAEVTASVHDGPPPKSSEWH